MYHRAMDTTSKPIISTNVSLKAHNTFNVTAQARQFATIRSTAALQALLSINTAETILPIGDGSNILLTRDFDGLVIHNQIKGIQQVKEDSDAIWLRVGAGENWHALVMHCVKKNLCGIENLSLIPGTVGAAPIQNIGAYGVEIKDCLTTVETIEIATQKLHQFSNANCIFGYRDSVFKNTLKNKHIITHVTLRLSKQPTFHIDYGAIKSTLQSMQIEQLSIQSISDAIIHLRQQKLPDPKKIANAGSFFKNPIIDLNQLKYLQNTYKDIPFYTLSNNQFKIPAAWLIEQCGFKGKRFNGIGIHDKQPLVLVNYHEDNGQALLALSKTIQRATLDKFGIELTPEVNIY